MCKVRKNSHGVYRTNKVWDSIAYKHSTVHRSPDNDILFKLDASGQ